MSATNSIGTKLYSLVQAYSDLGEHRTGSAVDRATIAWFADCLSERGGMGMFERYPLDRYIAECKVTLNGQPIAAVPLYYEGVGKVTTTKPYKAIVEAVSNTTSSMLMAKINQAKANGAELALIATLDPHGYLVMPNREPKLASGLPTVLVAGGVADELMSGAVTVEFDAAIQPDWSENVITHFGNTSQNPLVITTPLSGWFRCAGERGTGIAIAIELAKTMAELCPVLVVATTGHELQHLGLQNYLKNHKSLNPRAILHLGASVAAADWDTSTASLAFSKQRVANTSVEEAKYHALTEILQPIGLTVNHNPVHWLGEAINWQRAVDAPLLSLVGRSSLFHTAEDVPKNATNADLLAQAFEAISAATRLLIS